MRWSDFEVSTLSTLTSIDGLPHCSRTTPKKTEDLYENKSGQISGIESGTLHIVNRDENNSGDYGKNDHQQYSEFVHTGKTQLVA